MILVKFVFFVCFGLVNNIDVIFIDELLKVVLVFLKYVGGKF